MSARLEASLDILSSSANFEKQREPFSNLDLRYVH